MQILRDTRKNRGVHADVKKMAETIKKTFSDFDVSVEVVEVIIGPQCYRFHLDVQEPVRMRVIQSFEDDLKRVLECKRVDIEAPISGTPLIGITIPLNTEPPLFPWKDAIKDDLFANGSPLTVPLGKSLTGENNYFDIARAPHMLIGGSAGSGKSVFIHTMINSLLVKNDPDKLRLIFMDPKRTELTLYNRLPHLLTPVITDPKKGVIALKWLVKEMDRRFDILQSYCDKGEDAINISAYHKNIVNNKKYKALEPEVMPYIVVVFDELSDWLSMYPKEYEAVIIRIAQMGRGVGIHMILSTTRPSIKVISGLMKANMPTRIAFQVMSQVESRVILDVTGAERLYGKGDMLAWIPEEPKPLRHQSYWISKEDVMANVKKQTSKHSVQDTEETLNLDPYAEIYGDDNDDLYEDAKAMVLKVGKASTSYIQRSLGVGYSRAARLIDMLEERGIIGPAEGATPREVIKEKKKKKE